LKEKPSQNHLHIEAGVPQEQVQEQNIPETMFDLPLHSTFKGEQREQRFFTKISQGTINLHLYKQKLTDQNNKKERQN
jgi:hypothetical protein